MSDYRSVEFSTIVIAGFVIFLAIIGIIMVVGLISLDRKNAASPLMRKHGVVADKEYINSNSLFFAETSVLFSLDDGSRVRLRIPGKSDVVVGDTGTVTWQGNAFKSFDRDIK